MLSLGRLAVLNWLSAVGGSASPQVQEELVHAIGALATGIV